MKSWNTARSRVTAVLGILLVGGLIGPNVPRASPQRPPQNREEWREVMRQIPMPKKGCFKATYPKIQWLEVPCSTQPNRPFPPGPAAISPPVGGANDFSALVPNLISSAIGSFVSVSGVTSESSNGIANSFSLQLNTQGWLTTSLCGTNPLCYGWQQFIYSNKGYVFIQYWLNGYNAPCPTGWTTFVPANSPTSINCYLSSQKTAVSVQPISSLKDLSLTGKADSGGLDTVIVSTAAGDLHAVNQDSTLNLASQWNVAEFNIFGDDPGSQAIFNSGSTLVVRTTVHYGKTAAPACDVLGWSNESNNLTLVGTPAVSIFPAPSIQFTESNIPGTNPSCAAAAGVGDTHLTTFRGLLYDFQATGDFVLAQADPDFIVQARQVSGAPTWPNASVNSAVGTRMGNTRVAICLPGRLEIDGRAAELGDGNLISLPGGVDVSRRGNVYVVTDRGGDSLRAEVNATWINAHVGLGHWPANVVGLLANPSGNVNQIQARDGTVLTNPFSFQDLYGRYGDSWRVPASESLLTICGPEPERSNPRRFFFANNLSPNISQHTRAVCIAAGVIAGPLLDACTLDVAVIGQETAARVFVGERVPIGVQRVP